MDDDFGCEWRLLNRVTPPNVDSLIFDSYLHGESGREFVLYRGKGEFFAKRIGTTDPNEFFKAVRQEPKEEGRGEF